MTKEEVLDQLEARLNEDGVDLDEVEAEVADLEQKEVETPAEPVEEATPQEAPAPAAEEEAEPEEDGERSAVELKKRKLALKLKVA